MTQTMLKPTTSPPSTVSAEELLDAELANDADFRKEWDELALARLVAAKVVGYRADHKLTQRQLAEVLGVKQPFVARLESGDKNPELQTLYRLTRELKIEFLIDIAPLDRNPKLVGKRVVEQNEANEFAGISLVLAATG